MVTIKVCKLDAKGVESCKEFGTLHHKLFGLLVLMGVAAVINFFIGNAIGGLTLGWIYVGFSVVLSLIVLMAFIPVAGLVLFLVFWDGMTASMITVMGIATNTWVDAWLTITWWMALFAGIFVIILTIVKTLKFFKVCKLSDLGSCDLRKL